MGRKCSKGWGSREESRREGGAAGFLGAVWRGVCSPRLASLPPFSAPGCLTPPWHTACGAHQPAITIVIIAG